MAAPWPTMGKKLLVHCHVSLGLIFVLWSKKKTTYGTIVLCLTSKLWLRVLVHAGVGQQREWRQRARPSHFSDFQLKWGIISCSEFRLPRKMERTIIQWDWQTQRKLHRDNLTLLGINVPATRVLRKQPTPVGCIKTHAGIISRNENQKRPSRPVFTISAFSLDLYGCQGKCKHLRVHKISHFIIWFSNTFWMSTVIFDDVVTPKCDWRESSPTHQSTCSVGS